MTDISTHVSHHLRLSSDEPIVFEHVEVSGADVIQAKRASAMFADVGLQIVFHHKNSGQSERDQAILNALESLIEAAVRVRTATRARLANGARDPIDQVEAFRG